ncbi:MAG: hypothetical protein IT462_08210 [Planctomycetes bacterium]|nr:hypothetical protein [Planctomycetota bacterium]
MANRPFTEAEEKLVDADLREVLGASAAPDLIDRTLRRIQQPRQPEQAPSRLEAAPAVGRRAIAPRRWARVRYAVEALVLMAAVGLSAWVMLAPKSPGEVSHVDGGKVVPASMSAGPEAEFDRDADAILVKRGWFLIAAGAPTVKSPGVEIRQVDGTLLLRVGTSPREDEFNNPDVLAWFTRNKLELAMIKTFKRWMQVGGTALVLLSGSALVNGERVEAEKVALVEVTKVAKVTSIKDIESIPAGVTEVRGQDLTDGHLESLGRVASLRRVDLSGCERITDRGIELLAANKELTALDIHYCGRLTSASLSAIRQLPKLIELTANMTLLLKVSDLEEPAKRPFAGLSQLTVVFDDKGGNQFWTDDDVEELAGWLPNLTAVEAGGVTTHIGDIGLRALSKLASLQSLNFNLSPEMSDAGFSYLKSCPKLTTLAVSGELQDAMVEQIGGIASLEVLVLSFSQHFDVAPLTRLKNLRRLHVDHGGLSRDAANKLGELVNLEELTIRVGMPGKGDQRLGWDNLKKLRRLELSLHNNDTGDYFEAGQRLGVVLPVLPGLQEFRCDVELFSYLLAPDLAAQPQLKELRLSGGLHWRDAVKGNAALAAIAKIKTLEVLALNVPEKDPGIDWTPLKELRELKKFVVPGYQTLPALTKVLAAIPGCEVVRDDD